MAILVHQFLGGFVASDPEVSFTDSGVMRAPFRVGVDHWRQEHDGTFTRLDNSVHDLHIFGGAAGRAAAQLRKGDPFVAHGHVDTRYAEPPSRPAEREVCVARTIGHDLARTAYDVDRTPVVARQAEALPAVGPENDRSSPDAERVVPPTSSPVADRPAFLRPSAAPGHGIGL